eukprot:Gb_06082 [translate_table: standard]
MGNEEYDDKHFQLQSSRPIHLLTQFRCLTALRLIILLYYLLCRVSKFYSSKHQSSPLWVTAVICEFFFTLVSLLMGFVAWSRIDRKVYPERLALKYKEEGEELPSIDVFVTTADQWKEPPVMVVNTILSILAVDYPSHKLACYVSDDGASPFTFFALLLANEFAKKWVPFCTNFSIPLRAPALFFARPLPNSRSDSHFLEEYEEIKKAYMELVLNIQTAFKSGKVPSQIESLFSGFSESEIISVTNHPGVIKVLGESSDDGRQVPLLIYVSREKRPGYKHHFKAGALNALLRVSGVMTNSPFVLNLDCDMYVNNSQALLQSICFHLDEALSNTKQRVSFVQFPQRFSKNTETNRLSVLYDVFYKGLDGIQGPFCNGTGCVMRREALYGWCGDAQQSVKSFDHEIRNKFGFSSAFNTSLRHCNCSEIGRDASEHALDLIRCDYELHTEWGKEVGWIYGSSTEDVMTGLKLHCRGWRSVYYSPSKPAFVGSSVTSSPDMFYQRKRWTTGMLEIFVSKSGPLLHHAKGLMKFRQRLSYLALCGYGLLSLPALLYGILPSMALCCLIIWVFLINAGKDMMEQVRDATAIGMVMVFVSTEGLDCVVHAGVGMGVREWWNNSRMLWIFQLTSDMGACLDMASKSMGVGESAFSVTAKTQGAYAVDADEGLAFDSSTMFVGPTVLVMMNAVGLIAGIGRTLGIWKSAEWKHDDEHPLMVGEAVWCCWSLLSLLPFVKGLVKTEKRGGLPQDVVLKSSLVCAFISFACLSAA